MKMVKSLLLGSATGLVAIAGAQAADLPVKAKPVQYVKICSLYGAGFYYIPGTDTCLKVGGFVRAETNINTRGGSYAQWQVVNFDDRVFNDITMRARGGLSLDARTETAYGTLRSYLNEAMQVTSGGPGGPALFGTWTNRAFIQFAGFTMGRAVSFFDFDPVSAYSNQTNTWGSSTGGAGIFVWAYTAQFGNGFSASISAEDGTARRAGGGLLAVAGTGYAGYRWPDVVGNLRVDQSWGSAQIMGAIHDVNPGYYTSAAAGTGGPGDEVGYALGAGLRLNLPMLGHGDFFITQFTYTKGATRYIGSGLPGGVGYNVQNGNLAGAVTVGFGPNYDATYGVVGGLDLTEGWSVTAGLQHNWMPGWKTSLYGAYGELNYSAVSSARIAAFGAPGALGSSAAPPAPIAGSANWSLYQIGSRTVWTPVKNLDISLEAMYNHLNTAYANTPGYEDKGWWSGIFRVQRNFYP
jgi:hypothetical protein